LPIYATASATLLLLAWFLADAIVGPSPRSPRFMVRARVNAGLYGLLHILLLGVTWALLPTLAAMALRMGLLDGIRRRRGDPPPERPADWRWEAMAQFAVPLLGSVLAWAYLLDRWSPPAFAASLPLAYWMWATAVLFVVYPAGGFVGIMANSFRRTKVRRPGLPMAGLWIGRLERLLILGFVTLGYVEGVGFLVAAKSVFRFGELSDRNNRAEAEYIFVGTLISFAIAMAVGVLLRDRLGLPIYRGG
jgi:hypothetical protein